jgi:hypothetical protein
MTTPVTALPDEYVAARIGLLDALDALAAHRRALIVIGAQAVYLRTGNAGLRSAPFTTDADLALEPSLLSDDPTLVAAMQAAGFALRPRSDGSVNPGTWTGEVRHAGRVFSVPVDLMVPSAVLGGSTRGARVPGQDRRAARLTPGIEAVLVDNDELPIAGLGPDERLLTVRVAGPAALLVAKLHKLADRMHGPVSRLADKDAADILRLVRTTPAPVAAARLADLRTDVIAGTAVARAIELLSELFRRPGSPGTAMAVRAVEGDVRADTVRTQLTGFVAAVTAGLG